jgi:hypothetical protein
VPCKVLTGTGVVGSAVAVASARNRGEEVEKVLLDELRTVLSRVLVLAMRRGEGMIMMMVVNRQPSSRSSPN